MSEVAREIKRRRKGSGRLSRDLVRAAAMHLADEEGIEGLTMRRLARALGVETMTTYHYAASKQDVLDGIADLVVEEMAPTAQGGDWRAAVRASAVSMHDALRRHAWAADLLMSSTRVTPPASARWTPSSAAFERRALPAR